MKNNIIVIQGIEKRRFSKDFQNQSTVNTIVESCAIRDDMTECGVLSRADACKLLI